VANDDDKQFDPTPKRREDFRKQGRFPKARDAAGLAACAAAASALIATKPALYQAIELLFARTFGDVSAITRGDGAIPIETALGTVTLGIAPISIAAVIGAIALGAAQAGLRFDTEMLDLKLDRLNPLPKLQQLLSPKHAAFEVFLALLRVTVVGVVAHQAIKAALPELSDLAATSTDSALRVASETLVRLALKIGGALVILSVIDYAHNRFTLERDMRMSFKELKDEMRQEDGDPKVKAKLRAAARKLAKRRMMSDVKKADVIITNPTHVAVALRYGPKDPAPVVLAKGHDEVAMAIRAEARKHSIPIVESRSLARALDADIAIGKPIRGEHFAAVAQVLAFIYRLRKRAR
jgi:flagellar biosynthetic protein FlhB